MSRFPPKKLILLDNFVMKQVRQASLVLTTVGKIRFSYNSSFQSFQSLSCTMSKICAEALLSPAHLHRREMPEYDGHSNRRRLCIPPSGIAFVPRPRQATQRQIRETPFSNNNFICSRHGTYIRRHRAGRTADIFRIFRIGTHRKTAIPSCYRHGPRRSRVFLHPITQKVESAKRIGNR